MGIFDLFFGSDRPTPADLLAAETRSRAEASVAGPMAVQPDVRAEAGGVSGDTFAADDVISLVRSMLSGAGGGVRGPGSYDEAVRRILDCDPLDKAVDLRAATAAQVPIRLGRITGTSPDARRRTRAAIVDAQRAAGSVSAQLGPAGDAPLSRSPLGRVPGALALGVRMHQMQESGDMEEITDHPALRMIARPNPLTMTTWQQLLDVVVIQRVAWGETFLRPATRAARYGVGDPELFHVTDPGRVCVVLNERRTELKGYDLSSRGRAVRTTAQGGAPELEPTALVHIKDVDPRQPLRGRTHLRSLWGWSEIYLHALTWNGSLLRNGAKPSGILSRRDGRVAGGRQSERLREAAAERSGPDNAGKAWVDGELVWSRVSHSPEEMDWPGLMQLSFRRLAAGAGVDPLLLGVGEYSTYNNLDTAGRRLYLDSVLPDLAWLLSAINGEILPMLSLSEDLVLWADATEVPALQDNAKELAETLAKSTWLTDGERRVAQGYDAAKPAEPTPASPPSAR